MEGASKKIVDPRGETAFGRSGKARVCSRPGEQRSMGLGDSVCIVDPDERRRIGYCQRAGDDECSSAKTCAERTAKRQA